MSEAITIGIIGGSGLYDMAELTDREERTVTTPFGEPSGPYMLGTLRGKRVAFLARHGAGHKLMPTELNYRANIFGMKTLGVEFILSASAVGSLQERYVPQHLVIPDQFFDRTKGLVSTFFGNGLVAHDAFAHPDHDSVTVDMIIQNLVANAKTAQAVIAEAVSRLPYTRTCECANALQHAILTRPEAVPDRVKKDLAPIIGRYLK